MQLIFCKEWRCFDVSDDLFEILTKTAESLPNTDAEVEAITFSYRDPEYSPEQGGFHPVEIRLFRSADGWQFDYITDFSYQGAHGMYELVKELDFLFGAETAYHLYRGEHSAEEASGLFQLWQDNFISYVRMDVFQLEVSHF